MKLLFLTVILANGTLLVASESSSSSSYSGTYTRDTGSDDCADNDDDTGNLKTCGANETYVECPEAQCVPRKCSELGKPLSCPDQPKDGSCPGKPTCVCVDGFVRNSKNVCIPSSECPSCGGDKNKRIGCGVYCNQRCSDLGADEPRFCIAICYTNACDCKPGFYLNSKGNCVKPDQCDVTPTCKRHEVYSNCTNGGCDARNCSQLGTPVPCVKLDPTACKKGCICVDGYLRDANDTCVPKAQCPSCGDDPNAKPGCGVNCGRRCSTYKSKSPICPRICKVNGCDCKDKYVFDDNLGKCVLPKDCTPTCQVNEVFSNCTNGGCSARNCSQLGLPVPCVKLNPASCKKGWVCKEDYLRAANGTCIPKRECPPTCKKNEVFSNCTNGGCDARNCSQLGTPVPCVKLDPTACKKGCICVDGYLRAANGTCVPKAQCPSCGDDPNAKPGCGVNCGRRCSTYKSKSPICPRICKVNGCDCKDKYVFDDNLGKCVLPKDCPPTCQVNEIFSNCTNGGCLARNCSQLGLPVPCVKLDPASCKKGCVCKEDYLRAANGTCIPKRECPKTSTTTTTTTTTVAPTTSQCTDEDSQQCLTTGNIDFTLKFLYEMTKRNAGKSIVMSPFSVFIPLAELALYTQSGESYNQLMDALNLNTKDQIRSVFPALLSSLKTLQDVTLDLAAKVYVNQDAELTANFENDSLQVFGAKAENVDFSDAQNAADIINAWVEEVTRGLIQNLVSPSIFSAHTRLVLVNAIYFLGNWEIQFNPNNTKTEDFHVSSDKTIQVPMMYRRGSFRFADSSTLNSKILEIPYKGGNFSYVLFLPNEIEGYSAIAEKLRDPSVLNQALDSLSYQTCLLYLPRHDITSSIDLTAILNALNITGIFNSNTANLSGIIKGNEKLFVSDAIQKANIKVQEIGTEAAAANAFVVGVTSVVHPQTVYTVKADHPFLFFLFLKRNPLFCGVYAGN